MLKITLACLLAAVLLPAEVYGQPPFTSCPNGLILNFAQTACVARFRVSSSGPELESTGPWIATVSLDEGTISVEVTIELTLTNPLNTGILPTAQNVIFAAGTTGPSSQFVQFTVPNDNTPGGDSVFNVQARILQPASGLFDLDDITEATDVGQAIDSIVFTVIDDDFLQCSFTSANFVVNEGNSVSVGVQLFGTPSGNIQKTIQCVAGSAELSDFSFSFQTVTFQAGVTNGIQSVSVFAVQDGFKEVDETIFCSFTGPPNVTPIDPTTATVTIVDDDGCIIGFVPPPGEPPFVGVPSYCVPEDGGPALVYVSIISGSIEAPRQVQISFSTTELISSAQGGVGIVPDDYVDISAMTLIFNSGIDTVQVSIPIVDDSLCDADEVFQVNLATAEPDVTLNPATGFVTIKDDEDCCEPNIDDLCAPNAECWEFPGPNNFTCVCPPPLMGDGFVSCMMGVGDDPHFSIGIADGKMLCYTVQGEHGFAFNLISNEKVYMNAMFVPDSRREEVTWLGSMGIIVQSSGYKKSNATAMRFEVHNNMIYINDKIELEARNVEKLTFSDGKLTISEAPPVEGFKYPKVYVELRDIEMSFSIAFMNEHLDLYWHSTGQKTADSHGLIGQFFRKGIELDEVRKFLIIPGKEPVPVMRRPVWSFMERDMPDDQLCWTAMNPGYQGEGLIDGTYFDYVVNDVLTTDFTFKKQK